MAFANSLRSFRVLGAPPINVVISCWTKAVVARAVVLVPPDAVGATTANWPDEYDKALPALRWALTSAALGPV